MPATESFDSRLVSLSKRLTSTTFLQAAGVSSLEAYLTIVNDKVLEDTENLVIERLLCNVLDMLKYQRAESSVVSAVCGCIFRGSILEAYAAKVVAAHLESHALDPVELAHALSNLIAANAIDVAIHHTQVGNDLRAAGVKNAEALVLKVLKEWNEIGALDALDVSIHDSPCVSRPLRTADIAVLVGLFHSMNLGLASQWAVLLGLVRANPLSPIKLQAILKEVAFPNPDYMSLTRLLKNKFDEAWGTNLRLYDVGVASINQYRSDINMMSRGGSLPANLDAYGARNSQPPCNVADRSFYIPYFLSIGSVIILRPRRFGKTFWLSTLEDFFLHPSDFKAGRRISHIAFQVGNFTWNPRSVLLTPGNPLSSAHSFPMCPVLMIDLALTGVHDASSLCARLNLLMNELGSKHHVNFAALNLEPPNDLALVWPLKFRTLITTLAARSEHKKVVVLVDEYDSVLLRLSDSIEFESVRNVFRDFFQELKSLHALILLQFVTGISRWTMTDLFSGPNNMYDMTFDHNTSCLFGFTEVEIDDILEAHGIPTRLSKRDHTLSKRDSERKLQLAKHIKQGSGGYSFDLLNASLKVHNPFFVQQCLLSRNRDDQYWIDSATSLPGKYLKQLRATPLPTRITQTDLLHANPCSDRGFAGFLVHTGYATILSVLESEPRVFEISPPNKETSKWLARQLPSPMYGDTSGRQLGQETGSV